MTSVCYKTPSYYVETGLKGIKSKSERSKEIEVRSVSLSSDTRG